MDDGTDETGGLVDGGEVGGNGDATDGGVGDSSGDPEDVTKDGVVGDGLGVGAVVATDGRESSPADGVVCDNAGIAEARLWYHITIYFGWTRVAVQIHIVSKYFLLLIKASFINITSI